MFRLNQLAINRRNYKKNYTRNLQHGISNFTRQKYVEGAECLNLFKDFRRTKTLRAKMNSMSNQV